MGTKDYKTIHAALLFADLKYQVHTCTQRQTDYMC